MLTRIQGDHLCLDLAVLVPLSLLVIGSIKVLSVRINVDPMIKPSWPAPSSRRWRSRGSGAYLALGKDHGHLVSCQLESGAGSRLIKLAGLGCVLKESTSRRSGLSHWRECVQSPACWCHHCTAVTTPRISFYILLKSVLNEHWEPKILYLTWNPLVDVVDDVTVGKLLLELAADYCYVPDQVIHIATGVALDQGLETWPVNRSDIPPLTFLKESRALSRAKSKRKHWPIDKLFHQTKLTFKCITDPGI